MRRWWLAAGVVLALTVAGQVQASPLSADISSVNGEGLFHDTLACADGGDGPSWSYGYSGLTASGPLRGVWTGTVEVHDAGGAAFIPAGRGRLALRANRGGTAHLEVGEGGCDDATLSLSGGDDGEPLVTGTLPIHAIAGDGTLRGLTGSGTATFSFGVGAGADNPAALSFSGDFTVTPPAQGVGGAVPYYNSLTDYLIRKLTVRILLTDGAAAGDAYAVQLTSARLGAADASSGVPGSGGRINAGSGRWLTVTFAGAAPNRTYTLVTTVAATDSIDAPVPPVTQSRTIKTPGSF